MDRLVTIGQAAKILGVSVMTLRRWDEAGRLVPARTEGGHRRYDISAIRPETVRKYEPGEGRKTVAYARVPSRDMRDDLERQKQVLELFCSKNGWRFEIITDIGSGVNYNKKGLAKLLDAMLDDSVGRLVLTHKDRLLRYGAELVFSVCEAKGVEVVIINQGGGPAFEEELSTDVLEIMSVFSARLYGAQNRKNGKLLADVAKAVDESENDPGP